MALITPIAAFHPGGLHVFHPFGVGVPGARLGWRGAGAGCAAYRIRATIEAVADEGASLSVRTRSGEAATVRLKARDVRHARRSRHARRRQARLVHRRRGLARRRGCAECAGSASFSRGDARRRRGLPPVRSRAGSTMTNGAVEARIDGVDGPKSTGTYKGASRPSSSTSRRRSSPSRRERAAI